MTDTVALDPDRNVPDVSGARGQRFSRTLHSEWIKFRTVRSTTWSAVAVFVLGAGLTTLVCATSARWLASPQADEPVGPFLTWGMMIAQIGAIVLGTLAVTSEYGTGQIRATLAATPRRGRVLAAKAVVLASTLFVVGSVTALAGYLGGNAFLEAEGIGVPITADGVLRALLGSGLYLAGLGLFSAGVGLLVRHTAAALSIVLALVFVVGTMVVLLPGAWGEWTTKLMPGNAGSVVAQVEAFDPLLLDPWVGFAVFCAEVAAVLVVAHAAFVRRDA